MFTTQGTFTLLGTAMCAALASSGTARAQSDLFQFNAEAVASAGDVDGDGFDDIIAGYPGNDTVLVISGQTRAALHSLVSGGSFGSQFGEAIDGGKDVDGDGFPDFVIGAPSDQTAFGSFIGTVHLFSGRTGLELASVDGATASPTMTEYFGTEVNLMGDTDGDGLSEIAVSASGNYLGGSPKGAVGVFHYNGTTTLARVFTRVGQNNLDSLGRSICGINVGNDAYAEIAIGIPGYNVPTGTGSFWTEAGRIEIYNVHGTQTLAWSRDGTANSEGLGSQLANGGMISANSTEDLIVGSGGYDAPSLTNAGRVMLIDPSTPSTFLTIFGTASNQALGRDVAAAGDWNQDGTRDFISVDNLDDFRVHSGVDGSVLYLRSFSSLPTYGNGSFAAGDLDVNADGATDIVVTEAVSAPSQGIAISSVTCTTCYGPGVTYCFGHGGGTACPCANHSAIGSGQGCLHSFGTGASLTGAGTPSIAGDTLILTVQSTPPSTTATFFQGTTPNGTGTLFGDGLRCAVGIVTRLVTKNTSGGSASYPGTGETALSVNAVAGQTRYYQVEYRNAASFCTSATVNTSNGYAVLWQP